MKDLQPGDAVAVRPTGHHGTLTAITAENATVRFTTPWGTPYEVTVDLDAIEKPWTPTEHVRWFPVTSHWNPSQTPFTPTPPLHHRMHVRHFQTCPDTES